LVFLIYTIALAATIDALAAARNQPPYRSAQHSPLKQIP
jgi:hypothetical protein